MTGWFDIKWDIRCLALGALVLLAVLAPQVPAETIHRVAAHETLSGIAERYGLTVEDILAANTIPDPDALAIGQEVRIPPRKGVHRRYVVRPGDVLEHVAASHGVTVDRLASFNRLDDPDALEVGQVLWIPRASNDGSAAPRLPSLPAALLRRLDQIPVRAGHWKYIVIHHSGSRRGSAKSIDRYHREERNMVNGLAYHFVIGNGQGSGNGQIEIGNRWHKQLAGGHLASETLNRKSIGICLVGNYEVSRPTNKQMESLYALTWYLMRHCNLKASRVRTHTQINTRPTKCPGRLFPTQTFLARLAGQER